MRERFDVVVVGAGPAGSLAAMILARQAYRVALFDRKSPRSFTIGETLPPQVSRLLADLGLFERFVSQGHRRSPGIVSAWGSTTPWAKDYLFSASGDGWHIDRPAFNQLLREAAIAAGATFFEGAQVDACVQSAKGWTLVVRGNEYACQILVDATGRHSSSKLPHRSRLVYDRLITVAGLTGADVDDGRTRSYYTFIESVKDGWFYSALLPNGNYIVTFTTDADLYPPSRAARSTFLSEQLRSAPLTSERVREFPEPIAAFSAITVQRKVVAKTNWIAVGDAARSYDPIAGVGVLSAMNAALKAAPVIQEMCEGNCHSVDDYNAMHEQAFARYRVKHTEYYSLEHRWPDSLFWSRRHNGFESLESD